MINISKYKFIYHKCLNDLEVIPITHMQFLYNFLNFYIQCKPNLTSNTFNENLYFFNNSEFRIK